LNGRSAAYEQMGKLDQSLTDVERIAAIEPNEPWNFHRIARLNMAMGKGDAALAAVDRAIAIKPHEATFVGYRGELLKRLGRAEEARSSFRAALKIVDNELGKLPKPDGATLPSDRVRLLTLKMTILELDGQVEAEILVADVALKFQPDNVQMLIWRCRARVNAGLKLDLAKKDCDRAVANGGGDLHAHGTRGVLGLRSASWDAAIKDYDIILKEEPRDPHALYGRGLARLRKGDKADGERDIAAATRYAFDVDVNYATIGLKP
jgi:tetratricopeptide (TPR) repeat protein